MVKFKTYYLIFILLRLFDKISLKFIINHQIGKKRSSNNEGYRVVKEIIKIIRVNKDKRVKWKCEVKNKLIIFTYYLKLFFTLSYTIKLFYHTCFYLMI